MKRISIFTAILIFAMLFSSCNYSNKKLLQKRLQNMEKYSGNPGNIAQIKEAIEKYDADAVELQKKYSQIGIWYKILGTRYLDKKMYGEALKAFESATEFYPENPNLYYYVAVCAGHMSKQALDFDATGDTFKAENYLELSRTAYLRAIELDDRYTNALYGLGVLYVYELDQCDKAVPYLTKLLSIEKSNYKGMFALARAYYVLGEYDNAVSLYDDIIARSKSAEYKASAESLKRQVLDASYGL